MTIKVNISFQLWPYEQSYTVEIPEDRFKDMDKFVDSITSNLKMSLMSHVRLHHPNMWYKDTPLQPMALDRLTVPNTGTPIVLKDITTGNTATIPSNATITYTSND